MTTEPVSLDRRRSARLAPDSDFTYLARVLARALAEWAVKHYPDDPALALVARTTRPLRRAA